MIKPSSSSGSYADAHRGGGGRKCGVIPLGDWNSKRTAALFLRDLWRLIGRAGEFPNGDLTVGNTFSDATETATDLADQCGGVAVVGRVGAGFGLNGQLLPDASLQYPDLHHAWTDRHIESVTLTSPVSEDDLAELVAVAAGTTSTGPTGRTVRIDNQTPQNPRREGLTIDEIHHYLTSVDEQRRADDTETHQMAGALLADNEAAHYQHWLERIRRQDDTDTGTLLGHLPDWVP